MIVRDRPNGLQLFLMLRGSVLQRIWRTLLLNTLLAIFLGFRNNTAYDRYWEARKLWGEITLRARSLSRQCKSLIGPAGEPIDPRRRDSDVRVRMVHRAIAFAHALRLQLRDQRDDAVLQR